MTRLSTNPFVNHLRQLLVVVMLGTPAAILLKAAEPGESPARPAEQASPPARASNAGGSGTSSDTEANAVLAYRQAFIALRREGKSVGEKKFSDECLTMPLDAGARRIVARAAYALRMMHQGAARPGCDWASGVERGIDVSFSPAGGAGVLSSLACLRARMRFEERKSAEAVGDLVAALALARHVSLDGTLDSLWAGYDIEQRASQVLALHLARLDAPTIKDLRKRLDTLPAGGSVARATLRMEEELLHWITGEIKEAKDPESLLAFLSQLCGGSSEPAKTRDAKGRAFLEECGNTAKGVLQRAEEMRAASALLAKTLDLPSDRIVKEFERAEKKLAGNPLFTIFAPVLHDVRARQAQAVVRRALLSAALAVQLDGSAALKKHPDPIAGGPFQYVAFEGGFELRSKWQVDEKLRAKWKLDDRYGKPLTLTVGQRAK